MARLLLVEDDRVRGRVPAIATVRGHGYRLEAAG